VSPEIPRRKERACWRAKRFRIFEHLATVDNASLDAAANPSTRMFITISGVLERVPETLNEIMQTEGKRE
jgi:hypothetical protein